jgi:hypothetical protein
MPIEETGGRSAETEEPIDEACVATAVAPMHCEPRIASQMVSQQIAGHRVDILEEEGDWVRARGVDRYEAWMHWGFLARQPSRGTRQSRRTSVVSLGCATRNGSDVRRALPLRAVLSPDEQAVEGEVILAPAMPSRFPLDGGAIAISARDFFRGTSYLWGGVTPWGADCSGLVQSAYALHGMQLPRDAWQQAEMGAEVVGGFAATLPGDLLFFSDREDKRVTHVGVALGGSGMVHLALGRGGYAVERLAARTDQYVLKLRERFLFAKRLIP